VLGIACASNDRRYTRRDDSGQLTSITGTITGTIVLSDRPVSYYGVTITSNYLDSMYPTAKEIHNREGLFSVTNLDPGTYDVIIAGPGFARLVIPRLVVNPGKETKLGTLVVYPGRKVTGTVTDDNAKAVANATVTIRPRASGFELSDDFLTTLAHGVHTTHTDTFGRFEIANYAPLELDFENSQIVAVARGLSSGPYYIRDSTQIDITLLETGNVDGVIPRSIGQYSTIVARPVSHEHASIGTTVASDGSFRLVGVPVGNYQLILLGSEKRVFNVSVAPGATATVDFSVLSDD
jgi:hypothetical protein